MNPFSHFEDQFGHLQLSDNDAALHIFLAGWNSAMMEMMKRVNKMPFGEDTRASFAVYFQSQMVNVDSIENPEYKKWIGLTEQEHTQLAIDWGCLSADWVFYGAAIERKLRDKNK